MAHSLSPEQAVDLIVGGLLRRDEAPRVVRFQPAPQAAMRPPP